MLEPSFDKYVSILQKKAYSCSTYLKLMSAASVTEFIILGYVSKVVHHTELFEIEPVVFCEFKKNSTSTLFWQ